MAEDRKKINTVKVIAILFVTSLIFLLGIFFGNTFADIQLDKISEVQQDLRTQTLSLELQYSLAAENPCEMNDLRNVGKELYAMSDTLSEMESSLGKLNEDVLTLKEYYSLLEIRHWLFLKNFKEECNEDVPAILYFYSNLGDCEDCDREGYILTYIKTKYTNVNVFSFDINLDNPVIETLKDLYSLEGREPPILIINNKVYDGFLDKEELENILFENAM